ncbi:catabolic L-serine/threonine dehydratase [Yamadazyma tenuis]|uniref:L-serine ammonia-lyase n=1 Tax=Candida tenuis (strain ATCC 10573 / BCRC 21748 / CBS 615 / JCM 9827 / NBRC 10315 / NRRL Y-1498 / VKM Y-70) TaxID=590646 RepID=G3AWE6_CANTC|nr:tryptophan synthase beta subunit-like PLP-dependent enzyme [Yamadazyma tenuis ATCC 10573]EGV66525.1 tryptophan synthase beta subunit-like PLP-dependent enzyme [Yamadazyma tenuis ATCC 10573]WEJ95356.1 catabolic L-serine/threonine dehydratase [Yamadazyma tenuis]
MRLPQIKTSIVEATDSLNAPCRVFFKKENEQPSGSFKLRGIGYLIASALENAIHTNKTLHVFSSSGGNAGLAAAHSSKHFGVKCTVVVPASVSPAVVELLKTYGAEVVIHGNHWGEADAYLSDVIIASLDTNVSPVYCHPFDDPLLWKGHASMISEIEAQLSEDDLRKVKGVICSFGGGGLMAGVVEGLKASNHLQKVPVLAVEGSGAASFDAAINKGEVVRLASVNPLATSLASPYACQKSVDLYNSYPVLNCVIDELDTVEGTVFFYDTFAEVVEPACGAAISMVSKNIKELERFAVSPDDIIIVIVCGGLVTRESDIPSYRHMLQA